jgi:nucleoside-diphosphate-sugar epimerase
MIFVTGGAGFIGSNFVLDWLAQTDEPVLNFDKLTYAGNLNNLRLYAMMTVILKRMQFGRKSEKLDRQIEQLELKLEDLQADEEESAVEMERWGRGARAPVQSAALAPASAPRREGLYARRCGLP